MSQKFISFVDEKAAAQGYDYDEYYKEILKIKNIEDEHFWFIQRNRIIEALFNKYASHEDACIEMGAGSGGVARYISELGYKVAVSDLHPAGIDFLKEKGFEEIFQIDLRNIPVNLPAASYGASKRNSELEKPKVSQTLPHLETPEQSSGEFTSLKEKFDVVALFDVIEHIADDKQTLKNIRQMLRDKGRVFISVPAHMWLWCKEDELSQHCRRYELSKLKQLVEDSGFEVLFAQNRFLFIIPLLYLRSKLNFRSQEKKLNPVVNLLFNIVCTFENWVIDKLRITPFWGGSIFLVAKKREL